MIFPDCFLFFRMCRNPALTANYVSVADMKQIMLVPMVLCSKLIVLKMLSVCFMFRHEIKLTIKLTIIGTNIKETCTFIAVI